MIKRDHQEGFSQVYSARKKKQKLPSSSSEKPQSSHPNSQKQHITHIDTTKRPIMSAHYTISTPPPPTNTTTRFSAMAAKEIYTHSTDIQESLAIALHFLSGFQAQNWPTPSEVLPFVGRANTRTSQLDADIVVARHLSLTATLCKLVSLDIFPKDCTRWVDAGPAPGSRNESEKWRREGELLGEVVVLADEARDISEYFGRYHGVKGTQQQAGQMKELKALWEWYEEVVSPVLDELMEMMDEVSGGEHEKKEEDCKSKSMSANHQHRTIKRRCKFHPGSFRERMKKARGADVEGTG
ncbi:unnamed protein product [Periconia digitata]|uniref:Uncharacterized protein n=1 Tax=Periconia digitata TaxID=1303443 RepID=A0A9W4UCB0_9PLEO|nr:unnamed protein product [Periconia digitata]